MRIQLILKKYCSILALLILQIDLIFSNFGDSVYNLIVLQTTSNFPDVMMRIISRFRFACVYFIVFLTTNYLLLYNMIIGIYYLNYKQEIKERSG